MFDGIAPTLPASDMARAKAFYQKLGLEPLVETEEGSAQYQVGDTMFMLYPSEFAGSNQATAASFIVSDLAGAMAALKERGVVFEDVDYGDVKTEDGVITMPNGSKGSWFKDSEGNILGLFQFADS